MNKKIKLIIFTGIFAIVMCLVLNSNSLKSEAGTYGTGNVTINETILNTGDILSGDAGNRPHYVYYYGTDDASKVDTDGVGYYSSSGASGAAIMICDYHTILDQNTDITLPEGKRVSGWKAASCVTSASDITWKMYWVLEDAPSQEYNVSFNFNDTEQENITVTRYSGDIVVIPSWDCKEHILNNWTDQYGNSYNPGDLIKVDKAYTLTASLTAVHVRSNITSGTYGLVKETQYTSDFTSGWKVNGGSDGCTYSAGTSFYVPNSATYTFSE